MTALDTGRGAGGQFVRTIEAAERDAEAARLRARGTSYNQLAARYNVSKQAAIEMVKRALFEAGKADREQARAEMLTELDMQRAAVIEVLTTHHYRVDQGKVIYHGDGPMLDDAPVLAAVDRLLKIAEQRAKVLGLYAPTRSEHVVKDAWVSEIEALSEAMGVHDPDVAERVAD